MNKLTDIQTVREPQSNRRNHVLLGRMTNFDHISDQSRSKPITTPSSERELHDIKNAGKKTRRTEEEMHINDTPRSYHQGECLPGV